MEYIRSGINLCFLYAILKRGTLVHSHRHTQTLLDLMKRERKKWKKAREDQAKAFVLILLFSFAFSLPSVFSSSFFQRAFHLFDRWATFVAIERDLEVCVITGSRMGTASGWGGLLQRHMKAKMKHDPVDPGICGWKEGGRGGKMKAWAQRDAGS